MTTPDFRTLGVPFPLAQVLDAQGITTPFPIQAQTLPDTLAGRDVLGRGRTGSGKTLAFGIPLVARLGSRTSPAPRRAGAPLGLILAPTRELATQIEVAIAPLAAAYGLSTTTIFGGVSAARQIAALRAGVDIVVACPGRLEDLMGQRHIRLDAVEITVLDEADHMADLGFLPGVTRILAATPAGGQRMLFSATLDAGVAGLARRFLSNPIEHGADAAEVPTTESMEHHLLEVGDAAAKRAAVVHLASGTGRRILFTRTKHVAKRWARDLTAAGIPSVDLHGNLSQGQRDRNLGRFSRGEVRVLVATDVAARGVHVDDVELVVHVDPPTEHKAYLHRSGRTARGGGSGAVVTIALPEQRSDVAGLFRKAGISAARVGTGTGAGSLDALVGEVAPRVAPSVAEVSAAAASGGAGSRGGAGGSGSRGSGSRGSGVQGAGSRGGSGSRGASGGSASAGSGRPRRTDASTPAGESRGTDRAGAGRSGDSGTASRRSRGGRGRGAGASAGTARAASGSAAVYSTSTGSQPSPRATAGQPARRGASSGSDRAAAPATRRSGAGRPRRRAQRDIQG